MTILVVGIVGFFGALILKSILEPLITAEILGGLDDLLRRRVRRAAALLPATLAEEQEDEWLQELAALAARRVQAMRFTRGLAAAAVAIQATSAPAGAAPDSASTSGGPAADIARVTSVIDEWVVPASRKVQDIVFETDSERIIVRNFGAMSRTFRLVDGEIFVGSLKYEGQWDLPHEPAFYIQRLRKPRET